jgi:hypothetical protein
MTKINICEFKGYTESLFLEYLDIDTIPVYEISVPKLYHSEQEQDSAVIVIDYFWALYTGQILSRISEDFFYTIPAPYSAEGFTFIITCQDKNALAEALAFISNGYNDVEDAAAEYDNQVAEFVNAEVDEKIACEGYIQVIQEL